jgi:ankyrin repeat protein
MTSSVVRLSPRYSLSYTISNGHKAVIKLLIKRDDVETDSKNQDNRIPLSYTASNGHEAVIKLLIKRDDIKTDSKNQDD